MKSLFHIHFFVPNMTQGVRELELFYQEHLGFNVLARYGYVGNEHKTFSCDTSWDELETQSFRLLLVELERGAVNLVLMPSQFPSARMEHFGILLEELDYEHAFSVAKAKGLRYKRDPQRSFIYTPFGFAIELQLIPQDRYAYSDEDFGEIRIESLVLGAKEPEQAASLLAELLTLDLCHSQGNWHLNDDRCHLQIQSSEARLVEMNLACSQEAAVKLTSWPELMTKKIASFRDPFGVSLRIQSNRKLG